MNIFSVFTSEKISELIRNAQKKIVYAAPGLCEKIAISIIEFINKKGFESVEVIIDSNPEIYRLGYGEFKATEILFNQEIIIRKAKGLRIGILIIDENGWIFSPVPLLIESEPQDYAPNAIKVDLEQANILLNNLSINFDKKNENLITTPEIGVEELKRNDIEETKKNLENCPPQKFDLARRVRVYSSYIQFVELKLNGCYIHRHTIKIPSKILNIKGANKIKDRLKSTFKLIENDSDISSKKIENDVNEIRKNYIRSLGNRFGNVILKQKKEKFLEEIEKVTQNLIDFKIDVKDKLEKEFEKCRDELIKIFCPLVKENPPKDLISVLTSIPSEEQVKKYLINEFDKIFPRPESFIESMKLHCDFKDVTYEMLKDKEFKELVEREFKYINWQELYNEYNATKALEIELKK